ncbi:cytochrome P460 family protein [Yoonia sp. 208BN28-4]|uniref:cytochrome P460 family protein n=1 Tax=Yoonia sp. 208BN28-4 TaxID=3126505 RepID=UPI0030B2E081
MKMMMTGVAAALVMMAGAASAQDSCNFTDDPYDFDQAQVDALYECVSADLEERYGREGHEVGSVYRTWGATATGPFLPGPHGDRFLNTFANDIAFETYVQYGYGEDFSMPVGSVLAKESYKLRNNGNPRPGPLFIMTKVAEGEADEYGNWVYSGVQPNGKTMGVNQAFCHDCHQAFADQDSMGYPAPEVRLNQ